MVKKKKSVWQKRAVHASEADADARRLNSPRLHIGL